jgi:hypothetical protein
MTNAIEVVVLFKWKDEAAARDVMKAMGVKAAPRGKSDPASIASELKARAAYLRSRPMSRDEGLQQKEREVLVELDMVEVRARMLEVERKLGQEGPTYQVGLAQLKDLAFAVRGRFAELMEACREPWPARAKHDPKKRAEELAAIERFLAAKKAKATGTDGAGGAR